MASEQMESGYADALRRIAECKAAGRRRLDLSCLKLTALPPEIEQLSALRELYLYDNRLSNLPPEIWQLSTLERLILGKFQASCRLGVAFMPLS